MFKTMATQKAYSSRKVTVIKTFALPKLIYPFTVLPNPSTKICLPRLDLHTLCIYVLVYQGWTSTNYVSVYWSTKAGHPQIMYQCILSDYIYKTDNICAFKCRVFKQQAVKASTHTTYFNCLYEVVLYHFEINRNF